MRQNFFGKQSWRAVACLLSSVVVTAAAAPGRESERMPAADNLAIDEFSADISMTSREFDAAGKAVAHGDVSSRFRVHQVRSGRNWHTTVTTVPQSFSYVSLTGETSALQPSLRIEDEGDGSPARIYDEKGREILAPSQRQQFQMLQAAIDRGGNEKEKRQVKMPTLPQVKSALPLLAAALVESQTDTARRRSSLERGFGNSTGAVAGKLRYVRRDRDDMVEVLVDPQTHALLEENVVKGGKLTSHKRVEYEARGGALVRRRVLVERPAGAGGRVQNTLEASNVVLVERGGRR